MFKRIFQTKFLIKFQIFFKSWPQNCTITEKSFNFNNFHLYCFAIVSLIVCHNNKYLDVSAIWKTFTTIHSLSDALSFRLCIYVSVANNHYRHSVFMYRWDGNRREVNRRAQINGRKMVEMRRVRLILSRLL